MIDTDEYNNQVPAQPAVQDDAVVLNPAANPNPNDTDESAMMECNADDDPVADENTVPSGGKWICPYDESFDDEDEDEQVEDNFEWHSLSSSPGSVIDDDDEAMQERNLADITHGVHDIDVDQQDEEEEDDDVLYVGSCKFVRLLTMPVHVSYSKNVTFVPQRSTSNEETKPTQ